MAWNKYFGSNLSRVRDNRVDEIKLPGAPSYRKLVSEGKAGRKVDKNKLKKRKK
jgi:hypothetical protein